MNHTVTFDIIFLAVCGIAAACGLYAIQGKRRPPICRVLWVITLQLGAWAFGMALHYAADHAVLREAGRLLALLGWMLLPGTFVHFLLLLTGKIGAPGKKGVYAALYLSGLVSAPAAYFSSGFLYTGKAFAQLNGWDAVLCAILLFYLGWAVQLMLQAKRFRLLAAFVVALVLDISATFLFLSLTFSIPRSTVVFMLIPLLGCCFVLRNLQRSDEGNQESFFREAAPAYAYYLIGGGFVAAGLLELPVWDWSRSPEDLPLLIIYCTAMLMGGALMIFLPAFKLKNQIRTWALALALSVVIPTFIFRFASEGGVTVWAFSFLPMILCLLFSRRMISATVVVSTFLSQLLLWVKHPRITVEIDHLHYAGRIGIIAAAAALVFYVHSIYIKKMSESSCQIRMHKLIAEVSHEFVSAGEKNFHEKLQTMLGLVGEFVQCECAYTALFEPNGVRIRDAAVWLSPDTTPRKEEMAQTFENLKAFLLSQFQTEAVVRLTDTARMAFLSSKVYKHLLSRNIRGLVALPVKRKGEIVGFMAFTASSPMREWNLEALVALEVLAEIVSDADAKAEEEKHMNYLAYHDSLTQLPTRGYFDRKLQETIHSADKDSRFAVIFMDLDLFKVVNDTLGHKYGDQLLCHIAGLLTQNVRPGDTVARIGGDEFVLILDSLKNTREAVDIVERILHAAQEPVFSETHTTMATLSAGMAIFPQHGRTAQELLKNADEAMYAAKKLGRNRYALYAHTE